MIHSKDKIQYGTITIPFHVVKSKRIKTSEIIVESDKVTIRTPLNKSQSDIEGIISGKASWILKKQKEYKESIPQIIKPTYNDGSTLPYLGRNYPLRIIKNRPQYNIKFGDGEFTIKIIEPIVKLLFQPLNSDCILGYGLDVYCLYSPLSFRLSILAAFQQSQQSSFENTLQIANIIY